MSVTLRSRFTGRTTEISAEEFLRRLDKPRRRKSIRQRHGCKKQYPIVMNWRWTEDGIPRKPHKRKAA